MRLNSIRFKSTILYSSILFIILAGYNSALFFSIHRILIRGVDEKLKIKAEEISHIFQAYEKVDDISSQPRGLLEDLLHGSRFVPSRRLIVDDIWRANFETLKLKEDYINVLNVEGEPLLHSQNMQDEVFHLLHQQFRYSTLKEYISNVSNDSFRLRVINYPYAYKGRLSLIIQVATPIVSTYQFLYKLALLLLIASVVILLLTSFMGAFFAKKILKPVVSITEAADNISHKDLSIRIQLKETDMEIRRLIQSFNSMIDRLEKSFKHVNEFNSHVAHELKTPLAVIRGELELAVDQIEDHVTDKKILEDCLEEIDQMIRIVKDLLLIARVDYNPQVLQFEELAAEDFFSEIFEHSKILAMDKKIDVVMDSVPAGLSIKGDKVHLRRLFLNIIMNAIKFTPPGGTVGISIHPEENFLHIDITDTGEGIAQENLSKIFDKFFHIENGEKTTETGSGLGLSIALSIAKAHQGDITVASKPNKGSKFTVSLPFIPQKNHPSA
jgi:two-component system, OmpR family, heavy metal sensor histidine kinase CusS